MGRAAPGPPKPARAYISHPNGITCNMPSPRRGGYYPLKPLKFFGSLLEGCKAPVAPVLRFDRVGRRETVAKGDWGSELDLRFLLGLCRWYVFLIYGGRGPSGGTAFFAKKAVGKKAQEEGPSDGPLPLDPLPSTAKEGGLRANVIKLS